MSLPIDAHNAPENFAVRLFEKHPPTGKRGHRWGQWTGAGWYILRTCPCHQGQAVSRGYPSEAEARRVARLLSEGFTT